MLLEIIGIGIYEAFSILIMLLRLYLQRLLLQWMFYIYISIKFKRMVSVRDVGTYTQWLSPFLALPLYLVVCWWEKLQFSKSYFIYIMQCKLLCIFLHLCKLVCIFLRVGYLWVVYLLLALFFYFLCVSFCILFKVGASVSLKSHGMVDSLRLQRKTWGLENTHLQSLFPMAWIYSMPLPVTIRCWLRKQLQVINFWYLRACSVANQTIILYPEGKTSYKCNRYWHRI